MAGLAYGTAADGLLAVADPDGESEAMVDLSEVVRTWKGTPSELTSWLRQVNEQVAQEHTGPGNGHGQGRADFSLRPTTGPSLSDWNANRISTPLASDFAASELAAGDFAASLDAAAASAVSGLPQLSSNPTAPATLYLDFDGHYEATWGSYSNVVTPVYDRDSDPNSFNAEEAAFIQDVWAIVAEDYAPFNINVTTIEPDVLAEGMPSSAADGVALRVAIGGTRAVLNDSSGVIGRGYINSFTSTVSNVAYVFPVTDSGSFSSAFTIGAVVSHEAGHSFGLQHQSAVYDFIARWQGIMNPSVFGYEDAWWSQTDDQDDMAVLAGSLNGFGYRADDHADTIANATPLAGSGTDFSGSGIIGAGGDVDVWSLTTSQVLGMKVTVGGSAIGQNLDAVIDLLDEQGNVLVTADPNNSTDAALAVESAPTAKYIAVRSTGAYGRIGQYTISVQPGTPGVSVNRPATLATSEFGKSDKFSVSLNSKPTADVVIPVASSNSGEATTSVAELIFTPDNWYLPQTVTVTGIDDAAVDGVTPYSINLGPTTSADSSYEGLLIDSLTGSNADNDVPGHAFQLEGSGTIYADEIEVAADGSIYITGNFSNTVDFDPGPRVTEVNSGYLSDAFIAKYTASHELIWVQRFGADSGLTYPRGLALDSAGNSYISGYTSSA
ncbi:MAG: SBBP repeat-containing protein, partial [Aureliella sp.]